MRNFVLLFVSLFISVSTLAQAYTITEQAQVSILTMGPGTSLNDAFGHSAFRITDPSTNVDVIYDYGRFDFNTPNFYIKFAQGKLPYKLGRNGNGAGFINYYKSKNRSVQEQLLNLSPAQIQSLKAYLETNYLPENREYKYDFFFDNCATKIRDVLVEVLGPSISYDDNYVNGDKTFRDLIQDNLHWNSWGSFGIDIALGAVIDRKATPWEYQFLPEYVAQANANATITTNGAKTPLVKREAYLSDSKITTTPPRFITSPLFVFSIIALIIIFITFKDYKFEKRSKVLDTSLFAITGLVGVIIMLLWVATDHTATSNNYNLLWAFPLSLIFAPLIARMQVKKWIRNYVFLLLVFIALMVFHWMTGVQVFAIGLIPLVIALVVRYIYLLRFLKKQQATL